MPQNTMRHPQVSSECSGSVDQEGGRAHRDHRRQQHFPPAVPVSQMAEHDGPDRPGRIANSERSQ
jgi:hypothetical protein